MPLVKEIYIDEGLLILWEPTEELEWLKNQFPFLETDLTFKNFKNKKRQKEWLAVKMLLKHVGCNNLKVSYNDQGQPQIKHPFFKNVSISHSHELVGILLHPNKQVGLDIESLQRNFVGIEKKYLSEAEIRLAQQDLKRHGLFWCAKEAVYKTAGIAGLHFIDQIILNLDADNKLTAELNDGRINQLFHLNYFELNHHFVVFLIAGENK